MNIETFIKQAVEEGLEPLSYTLVNESAKHHGHAGDDGSGQTHFHLTVVSPVFEGKTRVARQRLVYGVLGEAFAQGLHALSLTLLTPLEKQP